MIPTPALSGTSAHRRRRLLLAPLIAVAVVLGIAAPAAAAVPSPSPTTTGTVAFEAAPLAGGTVAAGEPLSVLATLDNPTSARISGGTAELRLGDQPLPGTPELSAWLNGDADAAAGGVAATASVEDTPAGQTTSISVTVAADDPTLATRAAGIYPLWVTLGGYSARSVVAIGTAPSGPVATVVPITASPTTAGMLTVDELTELTSAEGSLTAQLDAVAGTGAVLAVDPAIVAAIRARGTTAPESARAWLDRLMALPNQRFALQFGDADVSTQFAAGLTAPLQPTSLSAYLDLTAERPAPTPTPTAATGATIPPTTDELLDVGADDGTAVYWPPSETASAGLVGALSTASPGALTIVDSSQVTGAAGVHGLVGSADVLVASSASSQALRAVSVADGPTERAAAVAAASAHLTFATAAAQGAPVLVVIDRASARDAQGLRAAVSAATTGVTSVGLSSLVAEPATAVEVSDGVVDAARPAALTAMLAAETQVESFASILDDPTLLTGRQRASILQTIGAGWSDDPAGWQAAVTAQSDATKTTLESVQIQPSSALNLLTAGTNLRFWIRNDLAYPVNVVLVAAPDDLRVDVERETPVTAAAAANTLVEVPVNARIGNGDVKIELSLRSPSFVPIGQAQTVDVNVRADWEGIGLVVLGVLAAGFVTIGVVRTVRRRQRDRADAARADDDNEEDA